MATKKKAVKKVATKKVAKKAVKKEKFNFFKVYVNDNVIGVFDNEKDAKAFVSKRGGEIVGRKL